MTRVHQNLMVAALLAFCGSTLAAIEGPTKPTPDLAGTWSWRWKGSEGEPHKHVLEVEGSGKATAARERFDEMEPVKVTDLKVVGKTVSFSVLRGERRSTYSGTLSADDTINGTVTVVEGAGQAEKFGWTATREPKPKEKDKDKSKEAKPKA